MSDSGDPKRDKDRELRAQREFYEQDPTPSATTHNKQFDEELRKEIVGSLSRAQVRNVDVMGEATIEREADRIMRAVSHHTKEAVEAARAEGKKQGKHEQRHQELGVSRWIAVGDEYDYWRHPMTIKRMHTELAATEQERGGDADRS